MSEPPKKKGRPAKEAPAVPKAAKAPPKKRGRPPQGGETTKAAADDEAAAEQLEEELEDRVEAAVAPSKQVPLTKKKPGKPAKKAKSNSNATAAAENEQEVGVALEKEGGDEAVGGKNYWLMKAEQEDREEVLKDGRTVRHPEHFSLGSLTDEVVVQR